MKEEEYNVQKQFLVDMTFRLLEYPENRVGYVAYHSKPSLVSSLTDDRDAFITAVNNRTNHPSLPTLISDGIQMAATQFAA